MMRMHQLCVAIASVGLAGCFGESVLPTDDDAAYGKAADLRPLCSGDNDGVIERAELLFPVGASVNYLINPPGTTVAVAPAGEATADGPEWSFTSTAGEVQPFALAGLAGKWYEERFPTASYAVLADPGSGLLGVFRVTDEALLLLGFVSEAEGETLMVYDQPVTTLRLPVRVGEGWVTGGRIVDGKLAGQPFASTDTYRVQVVDRGTAVFPYLRFANTLHVRVDVTQTVPGGVAIKRYQHLYFHECYGELGRMVSSVGETEPTFSEAAEYRRLAL